MALTTLWGISGAAVLGAVLCVTVTGLGRRILLVRLPVAALLMVIMLIPFLRGMSPAGYLYGCIGELSVTTLLLLLTSLLDTGRTDTKWRRLLLLLALLGGLVLYPFSLGPFTVDPYSWGYRPWWLLGVVTIVGLLAARRRVAATVVLALAVLAFSGNLAASTNLWDYLLDPLLVVFALGELIIRPLGAKFLGKKQVKRPKK
jgi:hypothetical protein